MIKTDKGVRLVDIVCNKCGRSCGGFEYAEVMAFWGDRSSKDSEHHRSHLCEGCYDSFVATFALPPRVVAGAEPFDPEDAPAPEREYLTEEDVQFIKDANADYERLRQNPEALARYQAKRERWKALLLEQLVEFEGDVPTKPDGGDANANKPDHS